MLPMQDISVPKGLAFFTRVSKVNFFTNKSIFFESALKKRVMHSETFVKHSREPRKNETIWLAKSAFDKRNTLCGRAKKRMRRLEGKGNRSDCHPCDMQNLPEQRRYRLICPIRLDLYAIARYNISSNYQ